jgi:hypothetical protein
VRLSNPFGGGLRAEKARFAFSGKSERRSSNGHALERIVFGRFLKAIVGTGRQNALLNWREDGAIRSRKRAKPVL